LLTSFTSEQINQTVYEPELKIILPQGLSNFFLWPNIKLDSKFSLRRQYFSRIFEKTLKLERLADGMDDYTEQKDYLR